MNTDVLSVGEDGLYEDLDKAQGVIDTLHQKLDELNLEGLDIKYKLERLYLLESERGYDDYIDNQIEIMEYQMNMYYELVEDLFDEIEVEHFLIYGANGNDPNYE